ncbi:MULTISPECIES: PLP-dependent aminotransferase family protein [unclassified Herbaspirillum]|uniref:MocR-like pyridoxine biosynthesis transcription factor PdxR n=1 Tax=unclassified Herbaspirillum TaxID=2624150 RepID=UPI000E2F048F|nr:MULTISPECIES: PLP-dependent aminotransferase family protein [unclassified Herbaspirillum]RFB71216.1 PLP-dependent aminotransferase family protein [Herbaspirillum sp. 3R-3a1]TFI08247.1 PLP-dependent aminotransferase family protein [Herbaspirillum sp. 3R11]TFI14662.1 PLP-dependent aminotransferase family protein [Herbaspirillum sp. 3R-11]TFI31946.1 PLP-dependent aminotransferase family protein [Herbaspirillum sp. 3C11]TFI31971.1 PLP-dependent aminotransferase family protein [Herbaspirillum sp
MSSAKSKLVNPLAPLDPQAAAPYYRQIYDRFRSAIAAGVLKPGDRIPSARALTHELGLARGTIEAAYSLLAAEGYIQARGQAGTIVTPDLQPRLAVAESPAPKQAPASSFRPDSILPFQMGLPALDAFPRKIWARLGARCVRAMQAADMAHPSVYGLPALRAEIASYLQLSRGISCAPAQVFVTAGYRHTMELIGHALLKTGDRIWVEDPGYPPTRELLTHMGMSAVPVPVDEDGMQVAHGIAAAPRARAAVVTPAHQSPLCVSLSLPRRLALLEWAARNDSWIVEDDYDGEYRYVSRPLPALKSLDRDGRVLYAGTFSKVLFPSMRLAYLVVPESQVERFAAVSQVFAAGSPALTQEIVTAFIAEGHFARHIQRMRKLYAERRDAVRTGLERVLGKHIRIESPPGGMHLIMRLRGRLSDRKLVARMREDGLYAEALTDWTTDGARVPALLVNFTNVASEAAAEALGRRILALM